MAEPVERQATRSTLRPMPVWHRVAVPVLLLVHAAACWFSRPTGFLTGQDDIEYMALAQSLRHAGYNMLYRVDLPIHAQYPPGYPAMLALWGWLPGDSFDNLALLSVVLSVATLTIAYFAARRVFGNHVALGALAILIVNPGLVGAGGNVASETPFTMLSMLVLLLLLSEDKGARYVGWAGALAILAALTRSVGVILVGAVGLHWIIGRRWKAATVLALASALLIGGWFYWTVVSPERVIGSSYIADVQRTVSNATATTRFAQVVLGKIVYYATDGGPHTLAVPTIRGTPIDNAVFSLAIVIGFGAGMWLLFKRWRAAAITIVLYGGLLAAWAWRSGRFLIPVLPVVVPTLLAGWVLLLGRTSPRWARGVVAVAVLALGGGGVMRTWSEVSAKRGCHGWQDFPPGACMSPNQASFFDALRYVSENVPEGDVFLVAKSGALWYYTGHMSVPYRAVLNRSPDEVMPYLREEGVAWVLVADLEQAELRKLRRVIAANCDVLALERHFPERTYLLRVLDGETRSGDACEAVNLGDVVVNGSAP